MKGSEKQINWANEIIERLDSVMDSIIANIPSNYNDQQKAGWSQEKDMMTNIIEGMRSNIHSADYAGDIIDLFKDVKTPQDLMGMWRVTVPNTTGQHKILGR